MGQLSFLRPTTQYFEHEVHESDELTFFSLKPQKSQKYFSLSFDYELHKSVVLAFVVSSLWVRSGFAFMGVGRRERDTGHLRTITIRQGG